MTDSRSQRVVSAVKPPTRNVSRRELLGRLRNAKPAGGSATARRPDAGDLLRARRPAMGSYFEVVLPLSTPGGLALADRALDRIEALEAQMTIYRDDSELSRVNATAHLGPVAVEDGLFDLIDRALRFGRETSGAYDVASGALSIAWGFVRGPKRVPSDEELSEARARSGSARVRLDRAHKTIAFDRPGIVLNLGSIGKGYAVDQAASIVRSHWWPTPALVHGGRSSLFALGSPPDRFGGRWPIAVRNPFEPESPLGTLWLRNRGLGTSGGAFQTFEAGGRAYAHIIDPRTGRPASDGPASVTVLAPTAAEADALSTAFYLQGPDRAADYCRDRPEFGALFVLRCSSSGAPPRLIAVNLGDDDFEPALGLRVERPHSSQ